MVKAQKNPTLQPLAYSVPEAAEMIGIGVSKMYILMRDEKLRAIKIGRRTLIPLAELERVIEQGVS